MIEEKSSQEHKQNGQKNTGTETKALSEPSIAPAAQAVVLPDQTRRNPAGETTQTQPEQSVQVLEEAARPSELKMLTATWVGIAIGAITGIVFIGQFWQMKNQTRILGEQARSAADDARTARRHARQQIRVLQQQVAAAQENVAAIQRQMRLEQRAWMTAVAMLPQEIKEQQTIVGPIHITNAGKTPARNVFAKFALEKVKKRESPTFKFLVPYTKVTAGAKSPNTTLDIGTLLRATPAGDPTLPTHSDVEELLKGEAYLAVYGLITYRDVFNVEHWAKFCEWRAYVPGIYTAKKCTDYNDVDNN